MRKAPKCPHSLMASMFSRVWLSPSPATLRLVLRWMGVVILAGGLATAASIWVPQDRLERQMRAQKLKEAHEVTILDPLAPEDSRRYTHEVERYYGRSGLLLDKATRWMEGLGEGKPLAWTVVVVSGVLAGGLFFVAAVYRPEGARPRAQPV
jgi:hypothetical protein